MALPGQIELAKEPDFTGKSDPDPKLPWSSIQVELDRISQKLDLCLAEIVSMKAPAPTAPVTKPLPTPSPPPPQTSQALRPIHAGMLSEKSVEDTNLPRKTWTERGSVSSLAGKKNSRQWVSFAAFRNSITSSASAVSHESQGRRRAVRASGVDLHAAWKLHTKKMYQDYDDDLKAHPMMRLVERTCLENLWEFLDDPDSSTAAYWTWVVLKILVLLSMLLSSLQTTETQILNPVAAGIWETFVDSIFLIEMLGRVISSPSKRNYFADPLNWADLLSAWGLPFRLSIGVIIEVKDPQNAVHVLLLLFLPLMRFLKLLRYFEAFRLMLDAFINSAESLPVLAYILSVITAFGATFIYLFEDRSNIPSMQHCIWLTMVTMTSVGYGDYYPTSLEGYLTVSVLTFVSVLFLALPVGIIGYEFTHSWQNRGKVLLINKTRKCLEKWGYSASDVKVLFDYVDVDGDGNLNLSEFIELIRQMRIGISVEKAFNIFSLFDDDHNGSLDCTEFLRHVFPEEYVKNQQEKQTPLRMSRAQANLALQHLDAFQQ